MDKIKLNQQVNTDQYKNIGQETQKDINCIGKSQDILCNKEVQCHEV